MTNKKIFIINGPNLNLLGDREPGSSQFGSSAWSRVTSSYSRGRSFALLTMRWTVVATLLTQWLLQPWRAASTPEATPAPTVYTPDWDWVNGTEESTLSILAYPGHYCNDSIMLTHRAPGVNVEQCLAVAAGDARCNPDFVSVRNTAPFTYCYCARAGDTCEVQGNDFAYDIWQRRQPHGGLRLAGSGANARQGRLEVYYNGEWGTVCREDFTNVDAEVACRQLGHAGGWDTGVSMFGEGSGRIWMEGVSCNGSESMLQDCSQRRWGMHNCSHDQDVGLVCVESGWTLVGDGFCRTASGSVGTYTTPSNLSHVQCREECARLPACMSYEYRWAAQWVRDEYRSSTCELHTGTISDVEPASYAQCWLAPWAPEASALVPAPAPTPLPSEAVLDVVHTPSSSSSGGSSSANSSAVANLVVVAPQGTSSAGMYSFVIRVLLFCAFVSGCVGIVIGAMVLLRRRAYVEFKDPTDRTHPVPPQTVGGATQECGAV
jgi:hypothetical protein